MWNVFRAMIGNDSDDTTEKQYFNLLSQGGLTVSSSQNGRVCDEDKFIARHN